MIGVIFGFLSGIISGMGIGGGMILIPSLIWFMSISQYEAQGINLWYFLPTAIVSLIVHIKNKNVEYKKILYIIPSGVIASLCGAFLAMKTNEKMLSFCFGVFLVFFGIKEVRDGFTNKK